jgi:AcrR family transcriptional regulator
LREAALDLLAEIGYDRLTIDAVAARARSSKTTIYRRWTGKAELVVDALNSRRGVPTIPDTGSLRTDLEAAVKCSTGMDGRFDAQLMMGLISALANDAELCQAVRVRLIDPSMTALKQAFERAVGRGEIDSVHNLDLLVSLFPALMVQRLLTTGETPDAAFAEQVVNEIILPLATCPDCVPAVNQSRS